MVSLSLIFCAIAPSSLCWVLPPLCSTISWEEPSRLLPVWRRIRCRGIVGGRGNCGWERKSRTSLLPREHSCHHPSTPNRGTWCCQFLCLGLSPLCKSGLCSALPTAAFLGFPRPAKLVTTLHLLLWLWFPVLFSQHCGFGFSFFFFSISLPEVLVGFREGAKLDAYIQSVTVTRTVPWNSEIQSASSDVVWEFSTKLWKIQKISLSRRVCCMWPHTPGARWNLGTQMCLGHDIHHHRYQQSRGDGRTQENKIQVYGHSLPILRGQWVLDFRIYQLLER